VQDKNMNSWETFQKKLIKESLERAKHLNLNFSKDIMEIFDESYININYVYIGSDNWFNSKYNTFKKNWAYN
jgi:hypothetical protein